MASLPGRQAQSAVGGGATRQRGHKSFMERPKWGRGWEPHPASGCRRGAGQVKSACATQVGSARRAGGHRRTGDSEALLKWIKVQQGVVCGDRAPTLPAARGARGRGSEICKQAPDLLELGRGVAAAGCRQVRGVRVGGEADSIQALAPGIHGCHGREADQLPHAAVHAVRGAGHPQVAHLKAGARRLAPAPAPSQWTR